MQSSFDPLSRRWTAVFLVVALVACGGKNKSGEPAAAGAEPAATKSTDSSGDEAPGAVSESAEPLEITATASSTFPPEAGAFYTAKMAVDGKLSTSWVEGSPGAGLGQSLTLKLSHPVEVTELQLWAGMWYSQEFWERANRPREIDVKAGDERTLCKLDDAMEMQVCTLEAPVTTDELTLTLKGSHSGTTWMDTGISEIRVKHSGADPWVAAGSSSASTELEDDGDGPYDAAQVADGMLDTMWCDGGASDGGGEWVEIRLAKSTQVSTVSLLNGMGTSSSLWRKGARIGKATLRFSDGSTRSVELEDTHLLQHVDVGAVTTSSVRLTIDSVVPGTKYDSICVSELRAR